MGHSCSNSWKGDAQRIICSLLVVPLLASGCATARLQQDELAGLNEQDRKVCEDVANKQADAVKYPPAPRGMVPGPAALLLIPYALVSVPLSHARKRQQAYNRAFQECLDERAMERLILTVKQQKP